MTDNFEPIDFTHVPLERLRDVVEALTKHLGLRIEHQQAFYGEHEYRFVPIKKDKP